MMTKRPRKFATSVLPGVMAFFCSLPDADAQSLRSKKPSVIRVIIDGSEWYHKGEYAKAKDCFDEARKRIDELSPDEQKDFLAWIEFNDLALAGRRRFGELLDKLEAARRLGRYDEMRGYIPELDANAYPSQAQKDRLRWGKAVGSGPIDPNSPEQKDRKLRISKLFEWLRTIFSQVEQPPQPQPPPPPQQLPQTPGPALPIIRDYPE